MVMICDEDDDDDDVACFFLFCQHHSCIMLLHCYFVYLRGLGALVNLFSIRFIGIRMVFRGLYTALFGPESRGSKWCCRAWQAFKWEFPKIGDPKIVP